MKKKYEEIRNEKKKKEKVKEAYVKLKSFNRSKGLKKVAQQALRRIDVILDDSKSDRRKKRRKKNTKL